MIPFNFKHRAVVVLFAQICLFFVMSVNFREVVAQNADGPLQLVEVTVREALAEVRENEAFYRNNGDRLQAMVEEKVAPHFNFERMAQLAVAQNWRNATEDERTTLTAEFKRLLIRSYANVTYDFRTDLPNIDISPRSITDNRATIRGEVTTNTGQRVILDVRMENRDQRWQVIDVMVDGVSLIVNYRASFAYEIEQGGFARLIETLRAENNAEQLEKLQNFSNQACLVHVDSNGKTLYLTGQLNFANAKSVHHEFVKQMDSRVEQVDCSKLEHADSTALALLLIATGMARKQQRGLRIRGLSSRLVSLAEVYGIDNLLNVVD